MDHHGLYQAVGQIEGSLAEFRTEFRQHSRRILQQLDEGHRVMHSHDKRLTALEARPQPPAAPAALSWRQEAAEILKAIAPAGGWAPWLVLLFLAITGNAKPELVRDFALGLPPGASSAPGSQ